MAELTDGEVQLLLEPNIGVVATLRPDGSAHLTAVWVDSDGEHAVFNTAEGRLKPKNLRRDPRASMFVLDRNDPYRWISVTGRAELDHEGAVEHIDKLAKKYTGRDVYGVPDGEQRVIVRITTERVVSQRT
jgi:PPOX class probable F420-dependent enzyme